MRMTGEGVLAFVWILTLAIAFVAGTSVGETYKSSRWRREAVERGVAEYDSATGIWQWRETE